MSFVKGAALLCMASWLLTGVAFAEQSNAALLTIDAQRDSTLHEPVQIELTIVNLTKEPIVFKLGQDRDLKWPTSFTVTDPLGDVPVAAFNSISR
jgi:hypothetical protein